MNVPMSLLSLEKNIQLYGHAIKRYNDMVEFDPKFLFIFIFGAYKYLKFSF